MMVVQTTSGNTYSYLRSTNEIVSGCREEDLRPIRFAERKRIYEFPHLQTFTLGVTTKCNFRCIYCCYSGSYRNNRMHGNASMSSADIDKILDFVEAHAKVYPIILSFYGGESLLEFPFISQCVQKAGNRWGNSVRFEVSTNGYLLSEACIDWLYRHEVSLFVSLDGTREYQDMQRPLADGRGTFLVIRKRLEYLQKTYPQYVADKLMLLMTVMDMADLPSIAESWQSDELLRQMPLGRISAVAPNYGQGVSRLSFEETLDTYARLLKAYERMPDSVVLKVFLERWLGEWMERPVFEMEMPQEVPTCLPDNRKIYIDTAYALSVCEKVPDTFRFGTLQSGIDWEAVDEMASKTYQLITDRCAECPIARLCDVCPAMLDLSSREMDVYCHNQLVMQRVKLQLFCEMAEKRLI